MRRIVIDTNILVSAVISPRSRLGSLLWRLLEESIVLSCAATLNELRITLDRSKFDRYISRSERRQFIDDYARITEPVLVMQVVRVCRDPTDDAFLSLAVAGRAEFILTGDEDLLALHPWRSIQILSPSDFLETLN